MKIERLHFETKEVEIREVYIDENGREAIRVKYVPLPTGKCLEDETLSSDPSSKA